MWTSLTSTSVHGLCFFLVACRFAGFGFRVCSEWQKSHKIIPRAKTTYFGNGAFGLKRSLFLMRRCIEPILAWSFVLYHLFVMANFMFFTICLFVIADFTFFSICFLSRIWFFTYVLPLRSLRSRRCATQCSIAWSSAPSPAHPAPASR
jgi:hypothetical protein